MEKTDLKNTVTLFCGGDTNLGRRMHYFVKQMTPFVGIDEMAAADCRLINLECVIGTQGEQDSVKHYFYLRARPEQTNILTKYNIDIVTTANNHAGDYGPESLMEQNSYLDRAGILHAGSGKNFEEAIKPIYKKVGDITLAIFSVDSRRRKSAAGESTPGTAYVPLERTELWKKNFTERIRQAHEKADVVIVCPHWGKNKVNIPSEETKKIGRLLIDLGADAVLGSHAHVFQGVENYKNRPIVYDMGDLLFDSVERPAGCFTLKISADGVEKIIFTPLLKNFGQTVRPKIKQSLAIGNKFVKLCNEFKTETKISDEGTVEINFNPPPRESKIVKKTAEFVKTERHLIEPLKEPRPEWTVKKVPDEAIISPQSFGPIKLVGYYIPPKCRKLTKVRMIYVETYWTIEEPFDKDCLLTTRGVPTKKCNMPIYGQGKATHEFLDYMWPVDRWKPGIIYREKFGLLPPRDEKKIVNVDLQMEIKVTVGEQTLGEFKDPNLIKMQIDGFPYV